MTEEYKGFTIPEPDDQPDGPGAFRDFTDDLTPALMSRALVEPSGSMYGPAWNGVAPLINKRFTYTTTTIASGDFSVPFPTPFPNALLQVTIANINNAFAGYYAISSSITATNINQLYCKAIFGGAAQGGITIKISVDALGW